MIWGYTIYHYSWKHPGDDAMWPLYIPKWFKVTKTTIYQGHVYTNPKRPRSQNCQGNVCFFLAIAMLMRNTRAVMHELYKKCLITKKIQDAFGSQNTWQCDQMMNSTYITGLTQTGWQTGLNIWEITYLVGKTINFYFMVLWLSKWVVVSNIYQCDAWTPAPCINQRVTKSGLKHVLFSPLLWDMIQFDDHIFQMGWNHQLDIKYMKCNIIFTCMIVAFVENSSFHLDYSMVETRWNWWQLATN